MTVKCTQCDSVADVVDVGHKLCWFHHRISAMRRGATYHNKKTPTRTEMEAMFAALDGMKCPACKRTMCLHQSFDRRRSVVTIQHYDNGTVGLLCHSCNARHRDMGDERFAACGPNQKGCWRCKRILPLEDFHKGVGYGGKALACRKCISEHGVNDRPAANARNRRYMARLKLKRAASQS